MPFPPDCFSFSLAPTKMMVDRFIVGFGKKVEIRTGEKRDVVVRIMD